MPSRSRSTQSRGVSSSTSTLWGVPLTLMMKAMAFSDAFSQDQDRIAPLRSVFAPLTDWLQWHISLESCQPALALLFILVVRARRSLAPALSRPPLKERTL